MPGVQLCPVMFMSSVQCPARTVVYPDRLAEIQMVKIFLGAEDYEIHVYQFLSLGTVPRETRLLLEGAKESLRCN